MFDVDAALTEYYDNEVRRAAESTNVPEERIRLFFEHELITPDGHRGLAYFNQEAGTVGTIPQDSAKILETQHVVRREIRGSATWFEIGHDRMVGPIRSSNRSYLRGQSNTAVVEQRGQIDQSSSRRLSDLMRALEGEQRKALSREIAAAAITNLDVDPEKSLLLAIEAVTAGRQVSDSQRLEAPAEAVEALYRSLKDSHVRSALRTHTGRVWRLEIDEVEDRVLSCGDDGICTVWAPARGELRKFLHSREVMCGGFLDSNRLTTVDRNGRVCIWGNSENKPLDVWSLPIHTEFRATTNSKGTVLAIASETEDVLLYSVESHSLLSRVRPRKGAGAICLSSDGRILCTLSSDGVQLWDVEGGGLIKTVNKSAAGFLTVAFSRSGALLGTAGTDGQARVWDVSSGAEKARLGRDGWWLTALAFDPADKYVVLGDTRGRATIWDLQMRQEHRTLRGHDDVITAVVYSHDGRFVYTASVDKTVRLWAAVEPDSIEFKTHDAPVQGIAFSGDGDTVITGSNDGTSVAWDAASGRRKSVFKNHRSAVNRVAAHPALARAATAGTDGKVCIWDTNTGFLITQLDLGPERILSVDFSLDGRLLAGSGSSSRVYVWDLEAGRLLCALAGHKAWVNGVAFNPQATLLASSSDDRTVRVWNLSAQEETWRWQRDTNFQGVTFCPDGRIAAGSHDGNAYLYQIGLTAEILQFRGHRKLVHSVRCNSLGTHLATASADQTARIWDLTSGSLLKTLNGHIDEVWDVAFDRTGSVLATASTDASARLWDVVTGVETLVLNRPLEYARVFHPSRDGWFYAPSVDNLLTLGRNRVTRKLSESEVQKYHIPEVSTTSG